MVSNHSAVGVVVGVNSGDQETTWREEGKKEAGSCSPEPMTSIWNALQIGYHFK